MGGNCLNLFWRKKGSQWLVSSTSRHSPSHPTRNLMSAINSLLNIAALRSRTVGFVACQLGSVVGSSDSWLDAMLLIEAVDGDCKQNEAEPCPLGDASGELGTLDGCVISILSRWLSNALLCGGDISTSLFTVARDGKR